MTRYIASLVTLLIALVLGTSVLKPAAAQDTEADNTATIQHFTEAFLNGGDLAALDEIYAADTIHHNPLGDFDVQAVKLTRAGLGMAMPDFHVEILSLTSNEEWVAVLYRFTGTFTGELPTPDSAMIPGNDAEVQLIISDFFRFDEEGRIAESWETFDNLSLMTQLGLLPASGSES
jgi:predicted ester cyclase